MSDVRARGRLTGSSHELQRMTALVRAHPLYQGACHAFCGPGQFTWTFMGAVYDHVQESQQQPGSILISLSYSSRQSLRKRSRGD